MEFPLYPPVVPTHCLCVACCEKEKRLQNYFCLSLLPIPVVSAPGWGWALQDTLAVLHLSLQQLPENLGDFLLGRAWCPAWKALHGILNWHPAAAEEHQPTQSRIEPEKLGFGSLTRHYTAICLYYKWLQAHLLSTNQGWREKPLLPRREWPADSWVSSWRAQSRGV